MQQKENKVIDKKMNSYNQGYKKKKIKLRQAKFKNLLFILLKLFKIKEILLSNKLLIYKAIIKVFR